MRFTLYKQVIVTKAFAAEKAWKPIFVQVPNFLKCFEWKVNSKSNVGSAESSSHATPDVSLRRKWLNAVQTRSLDSQTLSDRVCTNSGSHGNRREKHREESGWEGGKREKKTVERKSEKDWEREWKRMAGTFCYMCLQSIAPPSQAQHSPCRTSITNQSEIEPLAPASLSANQIQWIPISLYNA